MNGWVILTKDDANQKLAIPVNRIIHIESVTEDRSQNAEVVLEAYNGTLTLEVTETFDEIMSRLMWESR